MIIDKKNEEETVLKKERAISWSVQYVILEFARKKRRRKNRHISL